MEPLKTPLTANSQFIQAGASVLNLHSGALTQFKTMKMISMKRASLGFHTRRLFRRPAYQTKAKDVRQSTTSLLFLAQMEGRQVLHWPGISEVHEITVRARQPKLLAVYV